MKKYNGCWQQRNGIQTAHAHLVGDHKFPSLPTHHVGVLMNGCTYRGYVSLLWALPTSQTMLGILVHYDHTSSLQHVFGLVEFWVVISFLSIFNDAQ